MRERGGDWVQASGWSRVYFILCFSLTLACTALAGYALVNHDMAAIIAFAQEVLHGKKLYRDLITSQFPLIILMMMIPVGLHAISGMSVPDAYFVFLFVLLQACALTAWRIARENPRFRGVAERYVLLLSFYCGLFVLPLLGDYYYFSFGQREHVFCALVLPYVMLAINRLDGVKSARAWCVAAGVCGAMSFCIKPHYLLVMLFAELFTMAALRNFFTWRRIDALIIAVAFIVYLLLMVFLTPEYFALIPRLANDYQGIMAQWYLVIFFILMSGLPPVFIALATYASHHRRTVLFLLTLIAAGEIIYALPKIVCFYHAIPIYFFSLLLCVLTLLSSKKNVGALLAIPAFVVYVALETHIARFSDIRGHREDILEEVQLIAPYRTICFLNSGIDGFPVVLYAGSRWSLSFAYLEYLAAAYRQSRSLPGEPHYRTIAQMQPDERYFHEKLIKDLQTLPDAIVIGEGHLGYMNPKFDLLHYFMNDPRFRAVFAHYTLAARFHPKHFFDAANVGDAIYRRAY